jgi:hypothetical protein
VRRTIAGQGETPVAPDQPERVTDLTNDGRHFQQMTSAVGLVFLTGHRTWRAYFPLVFPPLWR